MNQQTWELLKEWNDYLQDYGDKPGKYSLKGLAIPP